MEFKITKKVVLKYQKNYLDKDMRLARYIQPPILMLIILKTPQEIIELLEQEFKNAHT